MQKLFNCRLTGFLIHNLTVHQLFTIHFLLKKTNLIGKKTNAQYMVQVFH